MNNKIQIINLTELRSFPENPFRVREDESFNELVLSIRENGLISPLVVRPHEEGGYEIISGHRRRLACEKAGLTEVPALIYALDRDSAAIALVDSNLHRENILPSEKAFAYKLKLEALSRQGTMNRNIYGLNHGEQEYFINGVRYLVSSRFEPVKAEKKVTILG